MFVELGAENVGFKQDICQEIAKTGKLRKVCQEKFAIQFAKKRQQQERGSKRDVWLQAKFWQKNSKKGNETQMGARVEAVVSLGFKFSFA